MRLDDRLQTQVEALLAKGEATLRTHRPNPPNVIGFPTLSADAFSEWQSQSLALLTRVFGADHIYVSQFRDTTKEARHTHSLHGGQGILRAVLDDLTSGYLVELRDVLAAEVFTDFLDMAKHLLDQGYKDPAASLVGAVLEDGLRRIASKAGTTGRNLGTLNDACLKAGAYNKLAHQQVTVWITTRNRADHGEFGEYDMRHVQEMHRGVSQFLAQHLV